MAEHALNVADSKEERDQCVLAIQAVRLRARLAGVNPHVPPPESPLPAHLTAEWVPPPDDTFAKLSQWFTSPKGPDEPWPGITCEVDFETVTLKQPAGPHPVGKSLPYAVFNWKTRELSLFEKPVWEAEPVKVIVE